MKENSWRLILLPILIGWAAFGGYLITDFWRTELASKELYRFVPVPARDIAIDASDGEPEIRLRYRYDYGGKTYDGDQLSPYPELNARARANETLHRWLTRPDELGLLVFVDPDEPSRSSVVRGWAREDRIQGLAYGMALFTLSLGLSYLLVRPVRRIKDLF